MADNKAVNFNLIQNIGAKNVAASNSRGHAYLLNEPICDEVSFSHKKEENISCLKNVIGFISEAIRRIAIMNAPENYMDNFINEDFIKASLDEHYDEISEILGKFGYEPKIYMQHLEDSRNHFLTTYNLAKNLTAEGAYNLSEEERGILLEAALLHDIGKSLIPDEIFNKPSKFTPDEREVMDLHSELGYILLKDSGLSNKTLNAIRNHHHKEQTEDKITEILSMCDVVSALKENRVYKKGMKDKDTAEILRADRDKGKLNSEVVNTGLDIMSFKPAVQGE